MLAYAAAALLWRTVGGVVTGLVAVRIVVAGGVLLQPVVVSHQQALTPVRAWMEGTSNETSIPAGSVDGWAGYADAAGQEADVSKLDCTQGDFTDCLIAAGVTYRLETYVPDSEYSRMMLTVSAFNLLLAGAAFGFGARGCGDGTCEP